MIFLSKCKWIVRAYARLGFAVALLFSGQPGMALAQGLSVGANGAASYTMPISVPPGIGGLSPVLSLTYAAGDVNGPVGLGWILQGVSVITRCPSNKQADGVVRAVVYGGNDKLCLDGQRLIQTDANGVAINDSVVNPGVDNPFQTSDSLGGSGMVREYRTDKDSYSRIRAYGAAGGDPNAGPAYFKVWTKGGQILEYGYNPNGNATSNALVTATGKNVVMAWPVSRIADSVGNYIDFRYWQRDTSWGTSIMSPTPTVGKEWNLLEVFYTGHASQQPDNKIMLEYEDRVDRAGAARDGAESYHRGSKTVSLTRLKAIRTFISWPANQEQRPATAVKVKTFKIAYDQGAISGRSRVKQLTECGGESETVCLPSTVFNYTDGGGVTYATNNNFGASALAGVTLRDGLGKFGVITGNFFNSGRTDILRWAEDPAQNRLYRSVGDGTFTEIGVGTGVGSFNLTDQILNKSDACYESIAADFDGDGATDILRVMRLAAPATGASCGAVNNVLFHSNGDGSFRAIAVQGIDLTRTVARRTDHYQCRGNNPDAMAPAARKPGAQAKAVQSGAVAATTGVSQQSAINCPEGQEYVGASQTVGRSFHLVDTNKDGLLDIIVTTMPAYPTTRDRPSDAELCADQICTWVYMGQPGGGFVEKTNSNLEHRSLYANPGTTTQRTGARPYIGDLNGDGLTDLLVDSGAWYSRGNGDFDAGGANISSCEHLIDFNGDRRNDCLVAFNGDPGSSQYLTVSNGADSLTIIPSFNLKNPGEGLVSYVTDPEKPTMSFIAVDIDGDGRGDILRWADDASQNAVFLSNGDGSFRRSDFNLGGEQLQKSDGTASFITGDFTGHGNVEILRFKIAANNGASLGNTLFTRIDPTPEDQLVEMVSPTGLRTRLTWVPLSNPVTGRQDPRYYHDFNTPSAASYPLYDLVVPMQVVASVTTDSGVSGKTVTTDYLYAGFKATWDGVMLGFREVRQQSPTSTDKYVTILNEYLQDGYNTGLSLLTRKWIGDLWGTSGTVADIFSETWNVYCDRSSPPEALATAYTKGSCLPGSRVRKPYLYVSSELTWDQGVALPTTSTVNDYDIYGNANTISTSIQGSTLDMGQHFVRTVVNSYLPANIGDDNWIIGRLSRSTVTGDNRSNTQTGAGGAPVRAAAKQARGMAAAAVSSPLGQIGVVYASDVLAAINAKDGTPDRLNKIATTAGSAPYAAAVQGVAFTLKVTPSPLAVYGTAAGVMSGNLVGAVSGGVPPYQYNWQRLSGDKFALSSNTISNPKVSATLALGDNITEDWRLTVTDAGQSMVSANVKVTLAVPAGPLVVTIAPSPLTIAANDPGDISGIFAATSTGGIQPHKYAWTRVTGTKSVVSDPTVSNPTVGANVAAGASFTEQWKVIVTDAAGKTATASVNAVFSAPAALLVPLAATRAVTVGATGTAATALSVVPTGGRAPYTYAWTHVGGALSTISNPAIAAPSVTAVLTPGQNSVETWQVDVYDSVGHMTSASIAITFNYPPVAMSWVAPAPASFTVPAPRPGVATGKFHAKAAGGIPPYTYSWVHGSTALRTSIGDPVSADPVVSVTLATAETVTEPWKVTATDSTGKTLVATVNASFNTPATLAVPLTATRAATANATTGIATSTLAVTPTGGRAPYIYHWDLVGGSRSTANNPDIAGAVVSLQMNVGETVVESWRVTVTDSVGNTQTASTVITFTYPAPALGLTFTPSPQRIDAPDAGLISLTVTANPTGGIPPYAYAWVRGTGTRTTLSSNTARNPLVSATLALGETVSEQWKLTVTDSAGKTIAGTASVVMTTPATLTVPLTATRTATASASTTGVATSTISLTPTGGRTPYTYSWVRVSGSRSTVVNGAIANAQIRATLGLGETIIETWRVTVRDSVGHEQTADTAITFTYPAPALTLSFTPTQVTAAANDPGLASGTTTGKVGGGVPPYSYGWTRNTGTRSAVSNAGIDAPVFSAAVNAGEAFTEQWKLTATDSVGKTISASVNAVFSALAQLMPTLAESKTVNTNASGVGTTTMPVTVTGGKAPYTYSWVRLSGSTATVSSTTVASPTLTATLVQGQALTETWQVTVRDSAGHSAVDSTMITFNFPFTALTVKAAPTTLALVASAPGPLSGTVTMTTTGGVAPYNYAWTHTVGTQGQILSGGATASATIGLTLAAPAYVSEQWRVDVTDSRGAKGTALVPTTFSLPGLAMDCITDNSNNFHCNVTNLSNKPQATIVMTASDSRLVFNPIYYYDCPAKTYCGATYFYLPSAGRWTGTITARGAGIQPTYNYDITVK